MSQLGKEQSTTNKHV